MLSQRLENLLQQTPWTEEQQQLFLSKFQKKQIKAMDCLLQEGKQCRFEAFVEKGILRSFYKQKEGERINQFYFEGQWVADYEGFISNSPSKVTIQALEDCQLLIIAKSDIDLLSTLLPNWDTMGKTFFEQLYLKKEKRNAALILTSAEERYLAILEDQPQLIARIPQYYIAQYIGIKPESLSRIRKKLAQNGKN